MPCEREISPVTQTGADPVPRAISPEPSSASFKVTNGRRSVMRTIWPRVSDQRFCRADPTLDLNASRAQPVETAPRDPRIRILDRDNGAADSGRDDRVGAGPGVPLCEQGSSVT